MNKTEIPTPRTDAFFKRRIELYHHGLEPQDTMRDADFARQLERENAAMRAEITEAKQVLQQVDLPDEPLVVQAKRYVDQHDWHVGINRGQAKQIDDANKVNAMMREVIKEADHALDILMVAKRGGMQPANALIDAMFYAADTRKKLKPYLP
jgi:hypothetical protein